MMDSPCIDICTIDPESGLCVGCSRTPEEISDWNISNNVRKRQILTKVKTKSLKKMIKISNEKLNN